MHVQIFSLNIQFGAFSLIFPKWRYISKGLISTCGIFCMCFVCLHLFFASFMYTNLSIYKYHLFEKSKCYRSCFVCYARYTNFVFFFSLLSFFLACQRCWNIESVWRKIIQILSLYFHKILDVKCDMLFSFRFHWIDGNVNINVCILWV